MVTLRMVCIAVALLLAAPIGWALADHAIDHLLVPGGELVNAALEESATVSDIVLAETPQRYDRVPHFGAPEQLVEGHTVFVTIDLQITPNVSNFTIDIVGDVRCETHFNASGRQEFGVVPVPNRINELHEECQVGSVIFVTPDPFVDSSEASTGMTTSQTAWEPTGRYIEFTAPGGQQGEAQEWTYDAITIDWLGEETRTTLYAWTVPVLEPWTHSDGRQKSWYCPIPEDRLLEMGVTHFTAYHESEMGDLQFV